jgi:hypothetical protein
LSCFCFSPSISFNIVSHFFAANAKHISRSL